MSCVELFDLTVLRYLIFIISVSVLSNSGTDRDVYENSVNTDFFYSPVEPQRVSSMLGQKQNKYKVVGTRATE